MRCNKARQEIIWERHHGAGSVVPFSLQAGNDIFFRFYLTKAELLALTKGDISFENNQISIIKTYYRTGRQDVITEPKTKQSVRTVEIPEFLKKEIKDFVDGHYGMPDDERLFPIVQEAVQHKMKRQIAKAGVKNIRVHDLRHSHVAYLINKGIEPLLIKERVGHKDIRIMLNTYGHLYPNQQRRVADLLDNEKGNSPDSGNC